MSAHQLKHSQDRTVYVLIDPTGENDGIVTFDEDEAIELWSHNQTWKAHAYNPVEGWARLLDDEWRGAVVSEAA